jgi:hypothetical protein
MDYNKGSQLVAFCIGRMVSSSSFSCVEKVFHKPVGCVVGYCRGDSVVEPLPHKLVINWHCDIRVPRATIIRIPPQFS